jgi:hypothetical protein
MENETINSINVFSVRQFSLLKFHTGVDSHRP